MHFINKMLFAPTSYAKIFCGDERLIQFWLYLYPMFLFPQTPFKQIYNLEVVHCNYTKNVHVNFNSKALPMYRNKYKCLRSTTCKLLVQSNIAPSPLVLGTITERQELKQKS